jgi:Ca2+-binding RTX toxin-like protein
MHLATESVATESRLARPMGADAARFAAMLDQERAGQTRPVLSRPGPDGDSSAGRAARALGALSPAQRERLFGLTVTREGGQVIVDAGDGDDHVTVRQTTDGGLVIKNEAAILWVYIDPKEVPNLVIKSGAGDDRIAADPEVTHSLILDGGAGDDEVTGGAGADGIRGGAGNDRLRGGAGVDIILGGAGDDYIDGEAGRDWLAGGAGNDIYKSTLRSDGGHRDYILDSQGTDIQLL